MIVIRLYYWRSDFNIYTKQIEDIKSPHDNRKYYLLKSMIANNVNRYHKTKTVIISLAIIN